MPVRWIADRAGGGNSYLVGSVLVDAGVSPLAVAPYKDAIRTIVLTHGHYDHTAHVSEIRTMCQARVAIHPLDAPMLTDDLRSVSMLFGARSPGIVADMTIEEGDRIEGLLVIHTPGHTPGSCCLYDPVERNLFSGDTVFTHGSFGRSDFPGGDVQALAASLERLAGFDVDGLYPGHESPVAHGGQQHVVAACRVLRGFHD
jgi:glyoxylase-like metal-dependent hydrolase (beta-lactamase superfamily II)